MVDSNNIILGRINNGSGGLNKTYEESRIIMVDSKYASRIFSTDNPDKLYLSKSDGSVFIGSDYSKEEYTELEIISVLPYGGTSQYGGMYFSFLVEVIDKNILHTHLMDERNQIERLNDNILERTL